MPVILALAATSFVLLLSTAGHGGLVFLYSALAPDNDALTWMHFLMMFCVLLAFATAGQRYPAKSMGLFLALFSIVWLIAAVITAKVLETDLLALPIITGAFLVLLVTHFAKLWAIDSKLTSKLVSLSTAGNLLSGKSPAMRVETGLRLLETIFPVSEVVVFDLQVDGSLLPVGRARKDASKASPTARNETWQQTVSQCEKAIADRQTVIVPSEYQDHAAKLAVPLEYDGEIIGVLFVDVRDDYEPDDQLLLEAFAGQLARNFQRNELKSRNLPHSNWWSSFSTQSTENRLSVVSLVDGIMKEKSFGALATSHLNEAHAVAYLDGTLAYLNKRICDLAGIGEEEIQGTDLFSLLDKFRTLVFNDPSLAIRRVLQSGEAYKSELEFPDSDQTLQLQIIPVKLPANADAGTVSEAAGKPACLLITLKNIAAKKENERLRSDVANLMSHELRTPITSINGFAEMLLLDGNISEEAREYLSIISSESQRASALLSNFLSVSNLEQADKKEVDKAPVKVNKIVREVIEDYQEIAKKKRIRIVEKESEYIPPVSADRGLITKAIMHLVDNAIKYSPERTSVIISTILESDFLRVEVEDRGFGIPKGEQEKIWQKFYRVARDGQSKEEESTGLGLSLVKEIVEQHNGEVSLSSSVGRGSRFSFKLPRL